MKNALLLIGLCLILQQSAVAQAGSTGMAFLKLGVGGRSLGMGEAYSAAANDPTATYYNPAALSLSNGPQLMVMHKSWFQETQTEYLGAQTNYSDFSFGLAVNSSSVNDIEFRTSPGPAEGTFTARNACVGLSAAYALDSSLAIGITANYLYEKIFINDATGTGFNFGAIYQTPWDFRVAASVNNLGSMNVLDNFATELPKSVRIGAAKTTGMESLGPNSTLTVAADVVSYTTESKTHLHLGAELDYQHTFAMRAGYMTGYDARTFTAGVGVRYNIIALDYAYAPFRYDLGTTHTFSLGFQF